MLVLRGGIQQDLPEHLELNPILWARPKLSQAIADTRIYIRLKCRLLGILENECDAAVYVAV